MCFIRKYFQVLGVWIWRTLLVNIFLVPMKLLKSFWWAFKEKVSSLLLYCLIQLMSMFRLLSCSSLELYLCGSQGLFLAFSMHCSMLKFKKMASFAIGAANSKRSL